MTRDFSVLSLISFSLLAATVVLRWTDSLVWAGFCIPVYPFVGAVVIRFCEWMRVHAADEPDFFPPAQADVHPGWTQVQRVFWGSVWPVTFVVSVIYYGFLIIIKELY